MAKKGQNFEKYPTKVKQQIIEELNNRESVRFLARKYSIPRGTISNWQRKLRYPEQYFKKEKQKKPLTLEDYKERYEIIKKYQAFLKAQRERK